MIELRVSGGWALALSMAVVCGCGSSSNPPADAGTDASADAGDDAGPDSGSGCAPGTQDANGDGTCQPDCANTSCGQGTCALDGTSGLAVCTCDPGYAGAACDGLNAPDTAGVLFWLDAADATSYVADPTTGAVSSWTDEVGGIVGTPASPPTTSPTLVASALNGRAVMQFDGVDDAVAWPAFAGLDTTSPTAPSEYTIFLVMQSAASTGPVLTGNGTSNNQLFLETTVAGLQYTHDPGTGSPSTMTYGAGSYVSSAWSWDAPHIVTIRKKSSEISMWIDGSYRVTYPTADTTPLDESLGLLLGFDGSQPFDGLVAELILAADGLDYDAREAIEDYLGAKWFGAAFPRNPTTFGMTTVWLDASRTSSLTLSADVVMAWANLGLDGGNFQNGGFPTARPTHVAGGLNGHDVVRFDGTDAIALNGIATYDGASGNAYTFAAVVTPPATGGTNTTFLATSGGNPGLRYDLLPSSPGMQYLHRWPAGTTGGDAFAPTFTLTNAHRLEVSRSGPSYQFQIDDQSSSQAGSSAPTANIGGGNALDWLIGGESLSAPTQGLNGDIAELIFMHAVLTAQEELALHQLLADKWGI